MKLDAAVAIRGGYSWRELDSDTAGQTGSTRKNWLYPVKLALSGSHVI